MTAPPAPPRVAERVLSAVLGSSEAADAILGDLHEEHAVQGAAANGSSRWRVRMAGTRGRQHASAVTSLPGRRRHVSLASGRSRRHFHITETPS